MFTEDKRSAHGFKHSIDRMTTGVASDLMIDDFGGCRSCPYLETEDCPHYGSVTFKKPHNNKVCSEYTKFIKAVTSQNFVGLAKQKQYVELIKDQMVKDRLFREFKQTGEVPRELIEWSKHVAQTYGSIIKQEEGSKVNIKRDLSPQDIAEWIHKKDSEDVIIDAEIITKNKGEQDGLRKETNEEIGESK